MRRPRVCVDHKRTITWTYESGDYAFVSILLTASLEPLRLIRAYFLCLSVTMFSASDAFYENRYGISAVHLPMDQLGCCVR